MTDRIKTMWKKCSSLIINRKKAVVLSLVNAMILTLVTYFMNNSPLFTGENLNLYAGLEYLFGNNKTVNDSVLLINVAYDKQIADKKINGIPVGNTDVTDREALIKLMSNLGKMPQDSSYRYLFLDVRFEAGESTEFDDELFEIIKNMKRLVVATHEDIVLASEKIRDKAAYCDYMTTLTSTNFVRFEFLRDEGESMPLRVYRDLFTDSIRKHGWFYTCNRGLCQKTHVVKSVLDLEEKTKRTEEGETKMKQLFYENLNRINDSSLLSDLAKKKYVIVGNMIDDTSDTYFGKIPNSVLIFSAFWALKNGENIVNLWIETLLFLLFFCISLSLFSRIPIIERIPWIRDSKSKILHFIISFLSYSTVLLVALVILFLCFNVILSIWVPALYFSIQKSFFTYKYMKV